MSKEGKRRENKAAPIQYNNPETAGLSRYDDEYRGPAVDDAIELSRCRIDLMEESRDWPLPDNLPSLMLELSMGVPEDQRQDWLRTQSASEEVTRLISYGMRSGEIPIWVAQKDGSDRLVAPNAMLEVDHATVVSGCYRPPNDRGWLFGRPLFVKHNDWDRFVCSVREVKLPDDGNSQEESKAKTMANFDSDDAPSGSDDAETPNIALPDAIRKLHKCVMTAISVADPAPWLEISRDRIDMFSEGDEAAFVRRKKMEERTKLILQRALLSGRLRAHFSDGSDSRDIPGWAWECAERDETIWFEGRLPLNVLLPDDWQRWTCHSVYLDREAFTAWLDNQDLQDPAGFPELPLPFDVHSKPEPDQMRLPPENPYVTLSEALSWIAFAFSLNRDGLDRAISNQSFGTVDSQSALGDAIAKLAVQASGGHIDMRGKYVESHSTNENEVLTAPIEPVRFEDFAQFDVLRDGLRYGTGLTWNKCGYAIERVMQDRDDAFHYVKVNRSDLLRFFPPAIDNSRAVLCQLPAALAEIGPVMGMEEALNWLAYGKPSDDVQIWRNASGHLQYRFSTGEAFNVGEEDEIPLHFQRYLQANRTLWAALQDGTVATFVYIAGSITFTVPRIYWNQVEPEHLDHFYRGMSDSDEGRRCPVLLSRQAFDRWRMIATGPTKSEKPASALPEPIERAPSVKAGRPPSNETILKKADEMRARGLNGYDLAKAMRLEDGFEDVSTVEIRKLINGRYKSGPRAKRNGA